MIGCAAVLFESSLPWPSALLSIFAQIDGGSNDVSGVTAKSTRAMSLFCATFYFFSTNQCHNSSSRCPPQVPRFVLSSAPTNCSPCPIPLHVLFSSSTPCPLLAARVSSRPPFHPNISLRGHCLSPWRFQVSRVIVSWTTSRGRGRLVTRPFISRHGRAIAR